MSIISGVTVNWALSPRIINIPAPYGETGSEVTVENLNDTLQDIEDDEEGIVFQRLRDASGKEELGGGLLVGLTIKLINAKVRFANRSSPTICKVIGGNLIAVSGDNQPMYPVEYSTNVLSGVAVSTSAALVDPKLWDESVSVHQAAGTFGKVIKTIKTLILAE